VQLEQGPVVRLIVESLPGKPGSGYTNIVKQVRAKYATFFKIFLQLLFIKNKVALVTLHQCNKTQEENQVLNHFTEYFIRLHKFSF
jgi:hypothetical protein